MSLHELEIQSQAVDVAFSADGTMVAVLHLLGVSVFEWKDAMTLSSSPNLTGRITFERVEGFPNTYHQICFAGKDDLVVLQTTFSHSMVERYGFDSETGRITLSSSYQLDNRITTLSSSYHENLSCPFVQNDLGNLYELDPKYHSLSDCKPQTYQPWVEVAYGSDPIVFSMSGNGHLYANSRLLVKNCTSFLLTPAHLILTTTNHLLKFVHITSVEGKSRLFPLGQEQY